MVKVCQCTMEAPPRATCCQTCLRSLLLVKSLLGNEGEDHQGIKNGAFEL